MDFERFGPTRGNGETVNPETPAWTGSVEDDGVVVQNLIKSGTAIITIEIQQLFAQDDIAVWIDWNANGVWETPSERVIWAGASPAAPDGTLVNGLNVYMVPVPGGAVGTDAALRARIWDTTAFGTDPLFDVDGGGTPSGPTTWGEVEDYLIPYFIPDDPEVDVQRPLGFSVGSGETDDVGGLDAGVATGVSWTIVNQGASNDLTFSNASVSAAVNCTAVVTTQASSPVSPGGTSSFTIEITPTAAGPFSFDVTFTTNDPTEGTYTFTVTGAGGASGTFLISNDAGESPDFADLGEAFDFLESTLVSGPVVLEVSEGTGPYTSDASYTLGDTPIIGLSDTNTLTIRAESGERPVINGSGAVTNSGSGTVALADVTNVTFEGFELTGGTSYGLAVVNEIESNMDAIVVTRNMVHGVTAGVGVLLFGGFGPGTLSNFVVSNNFIWDVEVASFMPPFPGQPAALLIGETIGGVVRHNTVVVNTGGAGNGAVVTIGPVPVPVADVSYNIFVAGSADYNIVDGFDPPTSADYNILYATPGAGDFSSMFADLAAWQMGTGLDANSSDADPELLSITHPIEDLHLTTTSFTALQAAVGSTEAFDIDGEARPIGAGREIGADEIFIGPLPPTIRVLAGGVPLADNDVIAMTIGDTVADLELELVARDANTGDTLDLTAAVTNSGNINGFVQNEWNATGNGVVVATPASGTVDTLGTITVVLTADDNAGNTPTFTFTLDVNNNPPAIAVTSDGNAVAFDEVLSVQQLDDVADLNLAFTVTDADTADTLSLTHSLLNGGAISGRVSSEWNASGTGGSIAANPSSGTFSGQGTITVNLTSADGAGGADAFRFRIRINDGPNISVISGITPVTDGGTLTVSEGATVASLGLLLRVTDSDAADSLALTATVTDSADIDGFVQSEWNASGTGGSIDTAPMTGTFDTAGSITVQLAADDGAGAMSSFSFTIVVDAAPVVDVTSNGDAIADMDVINVTLDDTVASLDLELSATDANGDDVTLTADVDDAASILDFDAGEWTATGTGSATASPTTGVFDRLGQIDVTVGATDGQGAAAPVTFTIAVNEVGNTPPVLAAPSAGGDVTVRASGNNYTGTVDGGGDLALDFGATDADGDTVTITVEVTGGDLSAAEAGFAETFPLSASAASSASTSATGDAGDTGTIVLTVTATDDRGGMARYTFTLTITDGGGGGCSCLIGGSTEDRRGAALLALLVLVALRRRRGDVVD